MSAGIRNGMAGQRPSLVLLAAGMSTRYGSLKQLAPVGPSGETLMDYSIHDAWRAGFRRVVLVVRAGIRDQLDEHLGRWRSRVELAYAVQRAGDLPRSWSPPPGRTKPWGTAHALLAAAEALDGPFAVANADDWYGPSSYAALARHFSKRGRKEQALLGFRLEDTLSAHGGVSRAVCEITNDGRLTGITEWLDVREEGGRITGQARGKRGTLSGDALVSMNLWGFTMDVFPLLREEFVDFLRQTAGDLAGEYLIPDAVGTGIQRDDLRVRVLPARDGWFGITHAADLEAARSRMERLTSAGVYPRDLFG
jgi:NDP-sugar pyrophosphorylase family protein